MQPSQIMTTHGLVKHQKNKSYIIPTISKPNHHSQHIAATSSSTLNFNTPTTLPPVVKEYMCFMNKVKSE